MCSSNSMTRIRMLLSKKSETTLTLPTFVPGMVVVLASSEVKESRTHSISIPGGFSTHSISFRIDLFVAGIQSHFYSS